VKASLYHRFPGGKADMVDAMLSNVDRHFADYVLKPASEEGRPQDRVRKIARRLREFYDSGKRWCLLDTLTLADSPSTLAHARRSMEFWIDVFARLGRDAGLSPAIARKRAQEAVAAIEGAWSPHAFLAIHVRFFDPLAILRSSSLFPPVGLVAVEGINAGAPRFYGLDRCPAWSGSFFARKRGQSHFDLQLLRSNRFGVGMRNLLLMLYADRGHSKSAILSVEVARERPE